MANKNNAGQYMFNGRYYPTLERALYHAADQTCRVSVCDTWDLARANPLCVVSSAGLEWLPRLVWEKTTDGTYRQVTGD